MLLHTTKSQTIIISVSTEGLSEKFLEKLYSLFLVTRPLGKVFRSPSDGLN